MRGPPFSSPQAARTRRTRRSTGWYDDDPEVRVRFGPAFDAATGAAASSTMYLEVPAGHRTPWHTHSAEEVVYVLEGAAEAGIGERTVRLEAGGLALIPSGEPHGLANVGDGPLRFLGFFASAAMVHVFEAPLQPFGAHALATPPADRLPVPRGPGERDRRVERLRRRRRV